MFVSYPVTLLETNIHKSPNAHYLYIMFFWDFSAYFFGGISTRRLHFYLFLINNCRKMKRKNCLVSSLWLPLFPPSRCLRGWDCQHCDHWRHGKLHNLRVEAEFLDSVHYCLQPFRFVTTFLLLLLFGPAVPPKLSGVVESAFSGFSTTISIYELLTDFSVKSLGTLFFMTSSRPPFIIGLANFRMRVGTFFVLRLFKLAVADQKKSTDRLFLLIRTFNSFIAAVFRVF